MINTIWEFIIENGSEFLLLLATAGAIIVYFWQKRDTKRSAATLILGQIDSIESIVYELKSQPQINNVKLYYSKTIIKENMWERYKHLFAKNLSSAEYRNVQDFFDVSEQIEMARKDILSLVHKAWEDKSLVKCQIIGDYTKEDVEVHFDKSKEESITGSRTEKEIRFNQIYDPLDIVFSPDLPINVLMGSISNFKKLSGTTAYEKIHKYSFSK